MRVASTMTQRNYLKNLENNYSNKFDSEKKINSYRKYQQASECPAESAAAMRVRKAIANLDNYYDNLVTAESIYSNAESSIMAISEVIQTTYEKCIEAANGTKTSDQLEMIAMSVEAYADEITRLMNITVADRKIFGGTNNSENAFEIKTVGDTKSVYYNGVDIDTYNDPTMFPSSNPSYCDIGIGMTLNSDGNVDEQSALEITFNGAEYIGCGFDETTAFIDLDAIEEGTDYTFELAVGSNKYNISFTGGASSTDNRTAINDAIEAELGTDKIYVAEYGTFINHLSTDQISVNAKDSGLTMENQGTSYSRNVIQNILDAAQAIREGDGTTIARFADRVYDLQTTVSLSIAKIGTQTNFIDFNKTRITNNLEALYDRQNDLESTDLASESTTQALLASIYSATLQMSGEVLPQSIFNFI